MPDSEPYLDCRTCPYVFSKFNCLHERCPFHRSELAEFRRRTEGKVHAMALEIWHPRTKPPFDINSEGADCSNPLEGDSGSTPGAPVPAGVIECLQDKGIEMPALTPYYGHGAQALHESVAERLCGSLPRQGVLPHL